MNKRQQRDILATYLRKISAEILHHVPDMPEDWDGFELGWFVARSFARNWKETALSPEARRRLRRFKKTAPSVEAATDARFDGFRYRPRKP